MIGKTLEINILSTSVNPCSNHFALICALHSERGGTNNPKQAAFEAVTKAGA